MGIIIDCYVIHDLQKGCLVDLITITYPFGLSLFCFSFWRLKTDAGSYSLKFTSSHGGPVRLCGVF